MSLLREIQAAAINDGTPVSTLLLKCQLLAARIGHEQLAEWVDRELNGYPAEVELPEYRRLGYGLAVGSFSGPFGSGATNLGIPMSNVEEKHRDRLFKLELRQSAAALELLAQSEHDLAMPWPADYVGYYADPGKFVGSMSLYSAHTQLPRAAVIGTLSTIRSRALAVATEIERANPEAGEALAGSDPLPREVKSAVTTNIYGARTVSVASDVVHGAKSSVSDVTAGGDVVAGEQTVGRDKTSSVGGEDVSRLHWFTRHPWWSASIIALACGAVPGIYLAVWGPHLP